LYYCTTIIVRKKARETEKSTGNKYGENKYGKKRTGEKSTGKYTGKKPGMRRAYF